MVQAVAPAAADTVTHLPAMSGLEELEGRPKDLDPSEATYVSPMYLRGPVGPQIDTGREFPVAAPLSPEDPLEFPPSAAFAPPGAELLAPPTADLLAPTIADITPPSPDPLALPPVPGPSLAPPIPDPLALPPAPAPGPPPVAPFAAPVAEPIAPVPAAQVSVSPAPPPSPPIAASISSSGLGPATGVDAMPALFSQAMPVQSLLSRPMSAALPVTGSHPAFGFSAGGDSAGPEQILLPGSIVGRYAIHSHVGQRGTGALYRAHDPRLGRDVSLQLWRASSYLPAAASPPGMRFLQQARALAQVSHPHVLALLDVGAVGPNVFLAMETFQGVTLDRWLAEAPRKLSRILDVFVKAGRGLAAVHGAGLVERDFQPGHVMVGKNNDVRVIDFGLTRILAATPRGPDVPVPARAPTDHGTDPRFARAASSITDLEVGEFGRDEAATEIDIAVRDVLPTEIDMDHDRVFGRTDDDDATGGMQRGGDGRAPASPVPPSPYAAPEAYAGGAVTARSDQFAFCAVLYEAVCGVKPFAGDTPAAILDNIRAGRLSPPDPGQPSRIMVPAWLEALLLRGLSAAPEGRYESMDALVTELETGRTRRARRLRWAAIIMAVLGSFILGAIYATMGGDDACADAQERLGAVWNDQVIERMESAFTASNAPEATAAHTRVVAVLDGYARAWGDMQAKACMDSETDDARAAGSSEDEATSKAKTDEQIEAERADRTACLAERLRSLQALAGALTADVDRVAVENAVGAAARLPSVESCASPAGRPVAMPDDDQARADIAALQAEIADASVQVDLGRHERMAAPARALLARAEGLEHVPSQARAHLLIARIQAAGAEHGQAEGSLRQALRLAEQGQDDDLAAEIWVHLVDSIGLAQERYDEAMAAREAAETAVGRARLPDVHRSALFGRMGLVFAHLGRHDGAYALAERAQALVVKTHGPDSIDEIGALETLGQVLQLQGRHRDALAPLERALALTERYYGRAHVRQVPALMAVGAAHLALGQPEAALTSFAQARDIEETYHGLRTARAADIATEMGRALCGQGKYEQAVAPLERAIELGAELHGAEHPRITPALLVMAELRVARGEHAQARQVLERALAIRERRLGAEHPDTAAVRARLGHVLVELGDRERAQPLLESALAAIERVRGENHPDLVPVLSGLGALWRDDDNEKRTRRVLERMLAILRQQLGENHPAVAAADGELGEALLVVDRPSAARTAFVRAREILDAEGRAPTPLLARVLTGLAVCELDAGAADAAIPLLERALTIHTERPGDPLHLAHTRFALARALWASRADRTRALTLGQQAEQALAGLGPRGASELETVKAWLESDGN